MVLELFSKRNKSKKDTDVYLYDVLPNPFRVQVTYLFNDLFGKHGEKLRTIINVDDIYKELVELLARDFGVYHLVENYIHEIHGYNSEYVNGFLSEKNVDRVIDYIEVAFGFYLVILVLHRLDRK